MKRTHCSPSRRALAGGSLLEMLVGASVSLVVVGSFTQYVSHVSRAMTRQQADVDAGGSARASMDDLLLYLRGADKVLPSLTVSNTTYTTDGVDLVFQAPAYNPTTAGVIISGIYDKIVFDYNPTKREIRETIVPGTGSIRPSRQGFLVAKNVAGVTYTFSVRQQFTATMSGSNIFTLDATPIAKPVVVVNGVAKTCTYDATSKRVTVDAGVTGADVQVLYAILPSDTVGLPLVSQINLEVTVETKDGLRQVRQVTMPGGARLRNRRS
jgi:hypothetical protein